MSVNLDRPADVYGKNSSFGHFEGRLVAYNRLKVKRDQVGEKKCFGERARGN